VVEDVQIKINNNIALFIRKNRFAVFFYLKYFVKCEKDIEISEVVKAL